MHFIDTHTHIDGEEFRTDLDATIQRAKEAGAIKLFVPAIDMASVLSIRKLCSQYPGYCYGMIGLHPEEVREDYDSVLDAMELHITDGWIGVGEVGLDYYWSREFEKQQLAAFERQVEWSVKTRLPLMIHCRKAQNEMVRLLRRYAKELPGGIFHCFTGNEHEAAELLEFENFGLGIGGVLTFRKSNLPATLSSTVPLDRIVLETDAPYMTPVPHRGERNESAYIVHIIEKMAEVYGIPAEEVARQTTENAKRYFPKAFA